MIGYIGTVFRIVCDIDSEEYFQRKTVAFGGIAGPANDRMILNCMRVLGDTL